MITFHLQVDIPLSSFHRFLYFINIYVNIIYYRFHLFSIVLCDCRLYINYLFTSSVSIYVIIYKVDVDIIINENVNLLLRYLIVIYAVISLYDIT